MDPASSQHHEYDEDLIFVVYDLDFKFIELVLMRKTQTAKQRDVGSTPGLVK